jgi:hypothetical protein
MVDGSHSDVNDHADGRFAGRVTITLGDLARDVVKLTAPEQMDLFAEVTARWEAGQVPTRRRHGWTGGSVASGFDHIITSQIIYPLLSGTFSQVLGTAMISRPWRRWRRRRHGDVPPLPHVRVVLDAEQIAAFRSICISHGITLGLSKAKATVLADAVHGALSQAMAASEEEK